MSPEGLRRAHRRIFASTALVWFAWIAAFLMLFLATIVYRGTPDGWIILAFPIFFTAVHLCFAENVRERIVRLRTLKVIGTRIYNADVTHMAKELRIPEPEIYEIDENDWCYTAGARSAAVIVIGNHMKWCQPEEQRVILAHEVGHIHHNDWLWLASLPAIAVASGLGFLISGYMLIVVLCIPFFRMLWVLLKHASEYRADAMAAVLTRDPLRLSRLLGVNGVIDRATLLREYQ